MKYIDLTGKQYERLFVIRRMGANKWNQAIWECKCNCGKITTAMTKDLKSGKKRSCGCLKKDETSRRFWKGYGDICGDYWSSLKRNAKYRNIDFDLDIEDAWDIYEKQQNKCALSGWKIQLTRIIKDRDQTASLDRIDSSKGYIKENVQWLHKTINICKHILTNDEFVRMCESIVVNQSLKTKPLLDLLPMNDIDELHKCL